METHELFGLFRRDQPAVVSGRPPRPWLFNIDRNPPMPPALQQVVDIDEIVVGSRSGAVQGDDIGFDACSHLGVVVEFCK